MLFFSRRRLPEWAQHYLDTPRPDSAAPWREVPYVVLDVETSGLNPKHDVLLSIGLVTILKGRIRMDQAWKTLVRPPEQVKISPDSIRIHGILTSDLVSAPPIEEILPTLIERLCGHVIVVHFATLDIGFLSRALQTHYRVKLQGPAIDTLRLAGTLDVQSRLISTEIGESGDPEAMRLPALARKAGLPVHAEHDALSDALTTAQLFLSQATRFERQGKGTLRHLLRAGGCLR